MTANGTKWITPEALGAALRTGGSAPAEARVKHCVAKPLGTGQLADSFRVELSYSPRNAGPASVFVKLPSTDADSAATASRIRAYERECRFYRDLLPHLNVRTPRLLGILDLDGAQPGIVLEDLSVRTRPLDQLQDGTEQEVRSVASQIPELQAPFWNDPEIGNQNWFYNRTTDHIEGLQERYGQSWHLHGRTIGPMLSSAQREVVERFGTQCVEWAATISGPCTLVHQDLRLDNLLWGADGAWLVDWQTLAWASPAWDLAFFLGSAVEQGVRRRIEWALVREHSESLQVRGVSDWGVETAWREYRRLSGSVLLAMVPAVGYVQATTRGFDMFASLVRRGAQQALDHDVLEFCMT